MNTTTFYLGTDTRVIADMKTIDRAKTEIEMVVATGANGIICMAAAPTATVRNFLKICKEIYPNIDIRFWRDDKKHEVDFVIGDLYAYEVKNNKQNIHISNYAFFTKLYHNVKFAVIDNQDIFKIFIENRIQ